MQEWKLPSQLIITDRMPEETDTEMFLRHEVRRRCQAEADLIDALDFINAEFGNADFLHKFLDKTINN